MQHVEPAAVCEALGLDVVRVDGELRGRCPHPEHDDTNPSLKFWRMQRAAGKEGSLAVWCAPCEDAGWSFGGSAAGRDDVAGLVTFVMHQRGQDGWRFQDSLNFLGNVVGEAGAASGGRARRSSSPSLGLDPGAAAIVARSQQDVERTVRGWSAFWSWKGVDLTGPEIRWLVEGWRLGIFTKGSHNAPDFPDRALAMPNYAGAGGGDAGVMVWAISRRELRAEWHATGNTTLTAEEEFLGEWESTRHATGSTTAHLYGEWRDGGTSRVILTEGHTDTLAVAAWTKGDDVEVLGLMGSGAARSNETVALLTGRDVTILMDSDASGDAATQFWTDRLARVSPVAVATLPQRGTDACEAGRIAVLEALKTARPA